MSLAVYDFDIVSPGFALHSEQKLGSKPWMNAAALGTALAYVLPSQVAVAWAAELVEVAESVSWMPRLTNRSPRYCCTLLSTSGYSVGRGPSRFGPVANRTLGVSNFAVVVVVVAIALQLASRSLYTGKPRNFGSGPDKCLPWCYCARCCVEDPI